ncbi:MAG: hypothetical protein ACP5KN_20380 [Armatimonadota bacterium]
MSDRMDEAREWLQERRSAGFSDEEIRAELAQRGWSDERIDELIGPGPPPRREAPRRQEGGGEERSSSRSWRPAPPPSAWRPMTPGR